MTEREFDRSRQGAVHVALEGSAGPAWLRARRIPAGKFPEPVLCSFEAENRRFEDLPVDDLSPTGLGLRPGRPLGLAPGTPLRELEIRSGGHRLWSGEAEVVYDLDTEEPRAGLRLLGLLDLARVHWTRELEGLLHEEKAGRHELPVAYRTGLLQAVQLLEGARRILGETEREKGGLNAWPDDDVRRLCVEFHMRWSPRFLEILEHLDEARAALPPGARAVADRYAERALLPLLLPCPMHSRASLKPRGYAGDYELMLLYFTPRLVGDSLYARFLHFTAQHYPLGRTVVERERTLRERLEAVARERTGRPTLRILNLAAGPALEMQRWLEETPPPRTPVELILVDQDRDSLAYAQARLQERIASRAEDLRHVRVLAVHFSVKQILRPRTEEEARVRAGILRDLDLVTSSGLFDYLPEDVAIQLVRVLHEGLAPGGGLFLGNLRREPRTSWLMESVLQWHLRYREEEEVLRWAEGLPGKAGITPDRTGRCLFLDYRRPDS